MTSNKIVLYDPLKNKKLYKGIPFRLKMVYKVKSRIVQHWELLNIKNIQFLMQDNS